MEVGVPVELPGGSTDEARVVFDEGCGRVY